MLFFVEVLRCTERVYDAGPLGRQLTLSFLCFLCRKTTWRHVTYPSEGTTTGSQNAALCYAKLLQVEPGDPHNLALHRLRPLSGKLWGSLATVRTMDIGTLYSKDS